MSRRPRLLSPRLTLAALIGAAIPFSIAPRTALAEDASPPPPPLWAGSAELSLALTTGNSDTQSSGLGLELLHAPEPWLYKAKAAYLNATNQGTLNAEIYSADLRAARKLVDRLDAFAQGAAFRNVFAGFSSRYAFDAGAGYRVIQMPTQLLRFELGGGYVVENRTDDTANNFAAGKGALNYTWKLSPTADLIEDATFVYDFKNSSDWRFNNGLGLAAKISEPLTLKVTYKIDYLNQPVPGKKTTDTATTAALVAKF